MTGEVIKSFLVGLGFGVDDSSLAKFNKAISSASLRVTALYASIKVAAAGIFYGISKISEGFEQMGYEYRIIAPAINKALLLRQELLKAYRAASINITKAVQQSVLFNFSLAKTKFALEAVYKSVGLKFLPLLTKQMDVFRSKIYANMPKIQAALERFVNFIFKAFEATNILGERVWSILGRVYDFFKKLHDATDGWSTIILAAVAAWKLLNLAFLTTPLGMILTGLTALLALYDDFQTQMEGGKSLFDWSSFLPVIDAAVELFKSLWETVKDVVGVAYNLFDVISKLFSLDFSGALSAWGRAGEAIIRVFKDLWEVLKGAGGVLGNVAGWAGHLFGQANAAPNLSAMAQPQPLMPANSGVNQRVSQETSIIVQGSADASATGKAVASEQGKVNFDMTRNMRGATR